MGIIEEKTLFVTCGATVPFPKLVSCVLRDEFCQELIQYGFVRLIIQFGRNYSSEFEHLVQERGGQRESQKIPIDQFGCGDTARQYVLMNGKLKVIGFDFSTKMQSIIRDYSDLVISHAGTGSILDSLRLNKPLIVCVNDSLMDNHQQQIADKFVELGYVWSCAPTETGLIAGLRASQTEKLKPFPVSHNPSFERLLVETIYS
ncbi:AAR_G0019840.mRNA.1.CDS.1 [Saccharomyces cerevisiae]|nr:Alg13p [Saccharomyces cerevisiae YJM193]AJR79045.1 Alg13p [Saccharomyces cerevisiae YJM271]AJS25775.1 Alg13p [Saccharomyces cerevisiae YJM1385]CAI4445859.1 BCN_G0021120.mRNA.1.CDS.1 [Saccharomyces cerevisiae]CAI4457952.1 BCE_3a_G0020990.mRNA.1.CDS.1 [Saccharomyces cerevisiae]